jgi:hypothetical protein
LTNATGRARFFGVLFFVGAFTIGASYQRPPRATAARIPRRAAG